MLSKIFGNKAEPSHSPQSSAPESAASSSYDGEGDDSDDDTSNDGTDSVAIPAYRFDAGADAWVETEPSASIAPGPPVESLTFLTYNVWFERQPYYALREKAMFEIMRSSAADFICLQECTRTFVRSLSSQPWVRSAYYLSDAEGTTVGSYGVVLLSRFPIDSLAMISLPTMMGREALLANVVINGRKMQVCTVHLESLNNAPTRKAQLECIWPALTADSAFFMGDFNFCSSWSREQANLHPAFLDAWAQLKPDEFGATIGDNYPSPRWKAARFDRLMYRSSTWGAQHIECVGTQPCTTGTSPPGYPSDHYGLLAKFSRIAAHQ